ncbi:glutamate--cysteine ligase [Methyloprofundus sedimenti]|uniref:Glutamate--cysteine ligase n=2 Tax=Methyloprofundus sedimenti TaxID=1420851 RepID=A0A1V8MAS2_9GAMM|nr:glutamate--cysteine ligase [Methyloprofundus sedimenti]OQK18691.1 glutamate--cysteine ligase [Methyloprofundus sedimenti]
MGQEINLTLFNDDHFDLFHQKLIEETQLLKELIEHKQCSELPPIAGFEIEAWLIDDNMQAAPNNVSFLQNLNDPLAFPELAKFNIELNGIPKSLTADVFSSLHKDLLATWDKSCHHAKELGNHILIIGTLPTLKPSAMTLSNMSDMNRYRVLNEQILKARGKPINLDIVGLEHLKFDHYDVMLEAATTSLQLHTQVPLNQAHHFYNASIIASAAIVASCANAPYLFGKNLWHESRIPLFEQAIETGGYGGAIHGPLKRVSFGSDYARASIMECFQENLEHFPILLPELFDDPIEKFEHLRLHNGTIWRWNRPLIGFDADNTPHIRIEHRTPSAGPTIIDSIANAAFYYGLTMNLSTEIMATDIPLPFTQAKDNFYQAARFGLDSNIVWFDDSKQNLQKLIQAELLPRARKGLQSLKTDAKDIDFYLGIIEQRIANKQTGSQWQRQFMQLPNASLQNMTQAYLEHQYSEIPVSQWEIS